MFTEGKITEIFCIADDFCKFYDAMMAKYTVHVKTLVILVEELVMLRHGGNGLSMNLITNCDFISDDIYRRFK